MLADLSRGLLSGSIVFFLFTHQTAESSNYLVQRDEVSYKFALCSCV